METPTLPKPPPPPIAVPPEFSFEEWFKRQERLNPLPKPPWFHIEAEIAPKNIPVRDIQRVCAKHYNITMAELLSDRRFPLIVRARQVGMFLCKKLTTHSLPQIGKRFGGRDHTTVLHAFRKIGRLIESDAELRALCVELANSVGGAL